MHVYARVCTRMHACARVCTRYACVRTCMHALPLTPQVRWWTVTLRNAGLTLAESWQHSHRGRYGGALVVAGRHSLWSLMGVQGPAGVQRPAGVQGPAGRKASAEASGARWNEASSPLDSSSLANISAIRSVLMGEQTNTLALYPVPCALCPVPCTLYPPPYDPYSWVSRSTPLPKTAQPSPLLPCTMYPVPCTLYPIPCTLRDCTAVLSVSSPPLHPPPLHPPLCSLTGHPFEPHGEKIARSPPTVSSAMTLQRPQTSYICQVSQPLACST